MRKLREVFALSPSETASAWAVSDAAKLWHYNELLVIQVVSFSLYLHAV